MYTYIIIGDEGEKWGEHKLEDNLRGILKIDWVVAAAEPLTPLKVN